MIVGIRKIDPSWNSGDALFFFHFLQRFRAADAFWWSPFFKRETPCNRRPLDRLSSREHYYETRTENLMIYRSIFSFNLSTLSRTWSPTSVRNLSTSWQTIGTKLGFKSLSPSRARVLVSTMVLRGLVSRISPLLKRNRDGKTSRSRKKPMSSKKQLILPKCFSFDYAPLRAPSSTEKISITELLHFPSLSSPFSRYAEMKLDFRRVWPLL